MNPINLGISIRALGYLVALSEERHFGRAATRCNVSQPTLSAQIKKLEEQLQVQLVERDHRRVMLTRVGAEIATRARRVLQEVGEIDEVARSHLDPLAGELRLGLIPTVGPYLLPLVAARLRKQFPRLRLLLLEHQTHALLARLESGAVDVVILALPVNATGVETEVLYRERFLVALPAGHPLSDHRELTVSDLDSETLLLLEEGHCLRDHALEVCSRVNTREPQDFRATSLETLRQMVAAGIGITLLPELAATGTDPAAGDLVLRPFRAPEPGRTIAAVWRKTSAREETVRQVCGAIRELMARDGARLKTQ